VLAVNGVKRILHFAERADTSGFFPQLAKWHDRDRYRMFFGTLGTMDASLRAQMADLDVRCLSLDCRSRTDYPLAVVRLAAFLRRERVDVVHTHLFDPSIVGLVAAVLARTPLRVMTRHYSDYHTRIDRPWHVRLDRMCTRLAHTVIAVSRHTAEHLIEREGAPAGKIHVILNGIDFARVRPTDADARTRLRRELGCGDARVLLMMARLHPEKGQSHLFRALPALKEKGTRPFVVWVAGAGTFEAQYRAEVEALGCTDVVRFLGFRRDAADLIEAADLVVLPSVAEAFGLVLAEALYLGKAVVATRVGGIPEIVADGIDGVLVPPADPEGLAHAIARLLDDPAALRRLSGAGAERVKREFSFETMMRRYEEIYVRLGESDVLACDAQSLGNHHLA
jgi:glycosyltransferase involved in cell wall biosynthesis